MRHRKYSVGRRQNEIVFLNEKYSFFVCLFVFEVRTGNRKMLKMYKCQIFVEKKEAE